MNSKDEVYYKICHSVLRLEVAKGHLNWTISDISRSADVTRSLIYYYFGKEKESVLEEAFRYVIKVIFNDEQEEKIGVVERMKLTLKKVQEMPYIFVLFYLNKVEDNTLGDIIKRAEKNLFRNLSRDFPHKTEKEIEKLYILELGAIAYNLKPERVEEVFTL